MTKDLFLSIMTSDPRDRGILTTADRSFLTGESEMQTEQSRRDARYRIRNRLRNAILDFEILLTSLEEKDRQKTFEKLLTIDGKSTELTSSNELVKMLTFLYEGVEEQNPSFEEALELAIEHAETRRGRLVNEVDVEITIDSEEPDVEQLLDRLRAGEDLSDSELDILVRKSDFEDLKDLIREGIIEGQLS